MRFALEPGDSSCLWVFFVACAVDDLLCGHGSGFFTSYEKGVMYIVNCRTSVGFPTNSCWSVVVSCKRNVTVKGKMVLWNFGFLFVWHFFLKL